MLYFRVPLNLVTSCVAAIGVVHFSVRSFGCALFIYEREKNGMKNKKLLADLVAVALAVSLCGCSNNQPTSNKQNASKTESKATSASNTTTSAESTVSSSETSNQTSQPMVEFVTPGDDEFDYAFNSELGGSVITDYSGGNTGIIIPDTLNGDKVVGVSLHNETIKKIRLPKSITEIGAYSFSRCSNLESVEIPDGVTTIGMFAFLDCISLESIDIPDSVTEIGFNAFQGCISLESIDIPDSVTNIGNSVFHDCTNLKNITIPDSVITLDTYCLFEGCTNLESIIIPKSVTFWR